MPSPPNSNKTSIGSAMIVEDGQPGFLLEQEANLNSSIAATLPYDILLHIFHDVTFDLFQAQCALVCRAWSYPASEALWSVLIYTTIPLCHILSPMSEIRAAYELRRNDWTEYYEKVRRFRPEHRLQPRYCMRY